MKRFVVGLMVTCCAGICFGCGEQGLDKNANPTVTDDFGGGTDEATDDAEDTHIDSGSTDSETGKDTANEPPSDTGVDSDTPSTSDGTGSETPTGNDCVDADSDEWCAEFDCDDNDPFAHQGAEELVENGRDDDCDGATDENTYVEAGLPSNPGVFFDGLDDPARAPLLVYPAADVLLPPSVTGIVFQWNGGTDNDLWRIRFDGQGADAVAYVTTPRFTPSGALWATLTQGNLNQHVDITVEGTSALSSATKGTSAVLRIFFAEESIEGGLYYWAASSTVGADYGIMRYDFGNPLQVAAEPVYTYNQAGRCVACHALSHDGTRMALNYDGGNGIADIVTVEDRTTVVPEGSEYYANFHSFSPDDQYLLSVYQGQMALRSGTSGELIEYAPLQYVTYPDWSSNGVDIVYTRATRTSCGYLDWSFFGGQIEVIQFFGPGNWSTPRVLVPASAGFNYYYPAISPDGQWVVFNRAEENGAGGCDPNTASFGDTYSDDSAELWVVPLAGGTPLRLDAFNAAPYTRTSWAKWSPEGQPLGDETIFWLTVSSTRPYPPELPAGGLPQIWMAAFHVERAQAGQDPSRPGFWLPFQDLTTNNHIPQWTKVVVDVH